MNGTTKKIQFSWHYTWRNIPDELIPHLFAEYRCHELFASIGREDILNS